MFLAAPYVEVPPEDIKVIDARRLPQQQQVADDVSIWVYKSCPSPFITPTSAKAYLVLELKARHLMLFMAAQEDIFDTLREVAAFSREVEEQNFRGGPLSE